MNILIVNPGRDGAGRFISLSYAKALKKLGNNIFLVVSAEGNNEEFINNFGTDHIYEVKNHKNRHKVQMAFMSFHFLLIERYKIARKFKEIHFDYAFKTFYHHWADFVVDAIKPKQVLTICHNPISRDDVGAYFKKLYKRQMLHSNQILILTDTYRDLIKYQYGFKEKDILYVPLGRHDIYTKYASREINPPYEEKNINFLFFGLIKTYKGLHILLDAYESLKKYRDNTTLRIVGNGDMTDYNEQISKIKDVYIDNRYIDDDEVSSYFAGPNVVLVLPYIDAGQSGVIAIAYEYGNTIIASNTDPLIRQLDGGKIGILFEKGNSRELEKAMLSVVDNPQVMEKQKRLAAEQLKKLDWDNIGKKIDNFMKEHLQTI